VVKAGDRVSIDAIKVGQVRRTGTVLSLTEGLSGTRLLVRWDDGVQTYFAPGGGNLIVEGPARRSAKPNSKVAMKKTAPAKKAPAKKAAPAKKSASSKKAPAKSRGKR
jgi:hypothetical protein